MGFFVIRLIKKLHSCVFVHWLRWITHVKKLLYPHACDVTRDRSLGTRNSTPKQRLAILLKVSNASPIFFLHDAFSLIALYYCV